MRALAAAVGVFSALPLLATAQENPTTLRIINRTGSIEVRITAGAEPQLRGIAAGREARRDDCQFGQQAEALILVCDPVDGAAIAVEAEVPYRFERIQAKTETGAIRVTGFAPAVDAITKSGNIELTLPWTATQLELFANEEPKPLKLPESVKFRSEVVKRPNGQRQWYLEDRLKDDVVTRGDVKINIDGPTAVTLRDMPIPADSPIKPHWLAEIVLPRLLQPRTPPRPPGRETATPPAAAGLEDGSFTFRSDVRMVNHITAVYDPEGNPLTGLGPDEFRVLEDGKPQKLVAAAIESTPFNLAIFLDLSHSTIFDRAAMITAARGFVGTAGPRDRVAVYALANSNLLVIQPLTDDREAVLASIGNIPKLGGQSPVYDTIALAYAEELHARPGERNGMILLTDGRDNQFSGVGTASKVRFRDMVTLARTMHAILYPVIIDHTPEDQKPPSEIKTAWDNLNELAEASGGRVFRARSAEALTPVYEQVEQQLRAVYSLSYYPQNQNFDGQWRKVEVQVPGRTVVIRDRQGYMAR